MDIWETWEWLYSDFNYLEALVWVIIGGALLWRQAHGYFPREKRGIIRSAAIAFFFFGCTDIMEADFEFNGLVPLWVWAWKIFFGAVLVKCRYDYYGIDRTKLIDRYSVFLLVIFLIVLTLIIGTWWRGLSG